jgi:hypothetical protein
MHFNDKLMAEINEMSWGKYSRFIMDEVHDFKTAERLLKLMIVSLKDEEKLMRFYQRYSRLRFPYERNLLDQRKWHTALDKK